MDSSTGKHWKEQSRGFHPEGCAESVGNRLRREPTPSPRGDPTQPLSYNPDFWYGCPYPSPVTRGQLVSICVFFVDRSRSSPSLGGQHKPQCVMSLRRDSLNPSCKERSRSDWTHLSRSDTIKCATLLTCTNLSYFFSGARSLGQSLIRWTERQWGKAQIS